MLDARLSCPRSGVNLVALSDCLLAIGGFDGHNRLRTVEKFDARQGQWTIVAPMKTRRSNFGSAVLNGFVYVMGGFNGVVTIALSERYDPEKDRWDRCAPLNFNRSALRASVVEQLSNPTQFSFHSNYDLNPG